MPQLSDDGQKKLWISFLKSLSLINTNKAASLVDIGLDRTYVSLVVVFAPNLKLHHLLYVEKTKIHKVIFPFGFDVWFMLLDDLLSFNFFCQLMQRCHIIKLGV